MLREIAGQWIVVPLGQRTVEFNAIMNLSETGALIWKGLEQGSSREHILQKITDEYNIDLQTADNDYIDFLEILGNKGLVEL